eukprot:657395-Amorphochlora_amoeboformis.AAC.1
MLTVIFMLLRIRMIVSSVDKPALHWSYSRERGGVTVKWDRIDVSIPVRQYPSEAVNDGQQQSITGVVNSTVTYVLRFGLKLKGTRSMNQIIILSAAVRLSLVNHEEISQQKSYANHTHTQK